VPRTKNTRIFPQIIDIHPTANCNLRCPICWGPDHCIKDGLTTNNWKNVIDFFNKKGTESIVFTGGEPLIRNDIDILIKYAKLKGMKITLSTNTILLQRWANKILPFIDEIGIPIDGSDYTKNKKTRLGTINSFQSAVDSIHYLHKNYPRIKITVRTVISKINSDDILNIGAMLADFSDCFDRWKIYQFTPIGYGLLNKNMCYISTDEFQRISSRILSSYKFNILIFTSEQRIGRYIFVGSEGNIFGVDNKGSYKIIGNFITSSKKVIEKGITELLNVTRNSNHAR